MRGPIIAAMGGALLRDEQGWRWRDGRAEPRVFDVLAMDAYDLPRVVRVDADGARVLWASLRRRLAEAEPDLAEFLRDAGALAREPADDPGAVEVPWAMWESWARTRVVGVRWDEADEEDLLREARSLTSR